MFPDFSGTDWRRSGKARALALSIALIFAGTLSAAAQTPQDVAIGVTTTDGGARIIYGPEYLAQFSVTTANELLQRIPGIQGALSSVQPTKRGFGSSGDQVLVNGKRLSGKTNTISAALVRIPAAQVDRVEVIRGSAAGLDVRSTGLIVNIILKGELVTGRGSWEGTGAIYTASDIIPAAQGSYAGDVGALSYLVSFRYNPPSRYDRFDRTETFFTPTDVAFERQEEIQLKNYRALIFTGSIAYSFSNGDIVDLHGRYADEKTDESEDSDQFDPRPTPTRYLRNVLIDKHAPSTTFEAGGDYEHVFPGGDVAKGLFVFNSTDFAQNSTFITTPAVGPQITTRLEQEDREKSEAIARGTYEWRISQAHQVEMGAEIAVNTLDKTVELRTNPGAGLVRTPLFNADARVRETRVEGFTAYIWQPRPGLFTEAAAEVEYSRIRQRGSDINLTRSFFYPRPRVEVRYDYTPRLQLRGRIERTVSQLSFEPFVATFIADDNRIGQTYAGNPNLRPEKAWLFEAAAERRFANDRGFMTFTANYKKISDRIETIPIFVPGTGAIVGESAPGNIGKGHSYDLRLNTTLRLDGFGIDGGILDLLGFVDGSRVTDPFTFERRGFENFTNRGWSFRFRQDTRWHGFSYGFNMSNNAPRSNYDIDFRQTAHTKADLMIFTEFRLASNMTMRAQADKLFRPKYTRERFQFVTSRADGLLLRREFRSYTNERSAEVSLRGTF